MKHRKFWIGSGLILLIVVMIAVYVVRNVEGRAEVETVKPVRKEIREKIVTSGILEAGRQQEVYFDPERGELTEISVEPGEKVKKGTILVRYSNDLLNSEKQQADIQVEAARVKRAGLLRKLEEAKKGGSSTSSAFNVPGSMSEEQIRQEIRLAELEIRQAQKQLETVRKRLERLKVKSALSGTVVQVNPSGGRGTSADPLVIVADLDDLKVRADVSELDVLKVKKGQSVTVRSDALPDEEWTGEVTRVAYLPKSDEMAAAAGGGSGQVVYPVEVRLEKTIPLKLGSNLIVEIVTEKRKALTLPQEAVKEEGGKFYVFAVEGGKAIRREVKVGVSDGNLLEILSGVKSGETVVLNPPENLKSGVEVRFR